MSKCYNCLVELSEENYSEEHIILNACGGRLASKDLLCKTCNNDFGFAYDAVLARQTSILSNILHIKRDRNKPPDIKGRITSTGEDIYIPYEGELRKAKPKIIDSREGNQVRLTIEARDMNEFKQIAKGLKKKYPGLSLEDLIQSAKSYKGYLNDSVTLGEKIGGEDAFRAVTKAAVNYFIYKGGDKKYIAHLLPYLKSQVTLDVARLHFLPLSTYKFGHEEVSHIIKLVGNPEEGILYCYLEYFNAQTYIVRLNENYDGPVIDDTYIYDIIGNMVLEKSITVAYDKPILDSIFSEDKEHPFSLVQERYERVVTIAKRRHDSRHVEQLSQQATQEAFKTLTDGALIDMELINKLSNIVAEKFVPFIIHKENGRRNFPNNFNSDIPPQ